MKILLMLGLVLMSAMFAGASTWTPNARLLDAFCEVESSGGVLLRGDRGTSLGHFQMQKPAWLDVVEWRKKRNLPTHDYKKNVLNPKLNRLYASNYLTILHGRLEADYKRAPTPAELYAAYNMGLTNFRKCNFRLAQVNSETEAKCQQVTALLE